MDMCGMMLIDMHGVRYANNLLKNPATKRLSGKREDEGAVEGAMGIADMGTSPSFIKCKLL